MDVATLKRSQLQHIAEYRERLRSKPVLRWLFFEITSRCNLRCKHCGSNCSSHGEALTVTDVRNTLKTLRSEHPVICLTGGEPLLHPDFFEIANTVRDMGFLWGMTTNATMIDDRFALRLKESGLSTVSVSLDGMESSHDSLRGQKGAWRLALRGIEALKNVGFEPQVTTVFHKNNFSDLEPLYSYLCKIGITAWRPINVEPIGRACESRDMLLEPEQLAALLSFIRERRFDSSCKMDVTFGCSHYLGVDNERMVRDHYFLCGAGILTAGVRSNGDICACLDVENIPELVQGNIRKDSFIDVWRNGFEAFRRDRTEDCIKCIECSERFICGGDSSHTWDYINKKPLLCYKDYGFCLDRKTK